MKYLASELQKFYRKTKNKLIFTNGMSLNQLSLEMWTELGYHGMDSSLLSRTLNGERLFTIEQLNTFCRILRLNETEKYSLKNGLGKDLLFKHIGAVVTISEYDELVADEATKSTILLKIKKLRNTGDIQEAIHMASFFEQILSMTPRIQNANLSLFAKILNEKVRCLIFVEKPSTILTKVWSDAGMALRSGYQVHDSDIISMAHGNIGGSLYVAQRLSESAGYLEQSFSKVDRATKVEYVRTLLNDYAFLKDVAHFRETYKKAEKILKEKEKYNRSHIASIHEAVSRSLALMGDVRAAKNFLEQVDVSKLETFYQSELIRGKVFVRYQGFLRNMRVDKDEIEHLFNESQKSKFLSFKRHRSQIATMYREMRHG